MTDIRNSLRLLALVLFIGCAPKTGRDKPVVFNINQLIDEQVVRLSEHKDSLVKVAEVGGKRSESGYAPTAESWKAELDIYRQFELVNKPLYADAFRQEDSLDDPQSNLKIHQYSSETAPLSMLRIYYQDKVSRVRKMEGVLRESNQLYTSWKKLTMEFEEEDGKPKLTSYGIDGYQKTVLRDTVRYSIRVRIPG